MSTITAPIRHRDVATISLIGFMHGVSHFFHFLLPPLFPWLMRDFGLSFTGIGATMTVFFVVSATGQALAGFLVDRFGAARVLGAGIGCFAAASLLLCFADGYPALALVAGLAGLGNSVFHPADFSILNHHVSQPRLAHAFSVHGLSGNIGWALSPVFLTAIAATAGWRWAALGAACIALAALLVLFRQRAALADLPESDHLQRSAQPVSALLFSAPLRWMCWLLFLIPRFRRHQNFATPILQTLHGLSRHWPPPRFPACWAAPAASSPVAAAGASELHRLRLAPRPR